MRDEGRGDGWTRSEVSLRLTKGRRAKLAALAADLQPGASPTEAIDRAIELASAPPASATEALAELGEAVERQGVELRREMASLADAVRRSADTVEALRALISELAESDEH